VVRVQVVIQRNVEVHQFGSLGVIDAGDVEVRAGEGGGDVFDIEKEKSGLRVVRFDGVGLELGRFNFVALFVGDCAFDLAARKGQRHLRPRASLRVDQAAIDVVGGSGSELGIVGGGERDLHVGEGDGLVAIVGDDEEDGQEAVIVKIDGEDFGFFWGVVRIGGDGDFFVGVVVAGGIGAGGLGLRLGEIFSREG
jgi:hypothetical protein